MNKALDAWIAMFPHLQCVDTVTAVSDPRGNRYRCDKPAGHPGEHEATSRARW